MAEFLTPLDVRILDDERVELIRDFEYQSDVLGATVKVPAGFTCDLASVPRWLPHAYATFGGRARKAAVVHDWLYRVHAVPKVDADLVFREAMLTSGIPRAAAEVMYRAVVLFGGAAWDG